MRKAPDSYPAGLACWHFGSLMFCNLKGFPQAQIQTNIERLPLLYDTLVSQNGKAAAIYVPILDKNESYRIAEEIRAAVGATPHMQRNGVTKFVPSWGRRLTRNEIL